MVIDNIIEYINDNYRNPSLSTDMIADVVGRSVNYIRSLFKRKRGISISAYIRQKRFDEVCRLLEETDLPAQEIAKTVGFVSGNYFYTAFKKHTGFTCEQYRRMRGGGGKN